MPTLLTLKDSRALQFTSAGSKTGFPLIWIHGTPSGYPVIPGLAKACEKKNIKLIAFSRAGYGDSTRRKGRRVIDEVDDVQELMAHLGIQECFVGGWSGGGPPTLACAARLNGCKAATAVASPSPYDLADFDWLAGQGQDNIDELNAAFKGEAELTKFCEAFRTEILASDAAGLADVMSSLLPDVDKKALAESPEFTAFTAETFHVGLEHSADGWVDDDLALIRPWGFDLSEIKVPLFQYQGSDDLMVPFQQGKWLAKHLPKDYTTSHLEQSHGHISIFFGKEEAMLDELLSALKS